MKLLMSFACVLIFVGCNIQSEDASKMGEVKIETPLPSWNDTEIRKKIIHFVNSVCDSSQSTFVKKVDRIAVFDNDGTLWSEKPFYFQLYYAIARLRYLAHQLDIPEESPLGQLLMGNMSEFMKSGKQGIEDLIMTTHADMKTEEFEDFVSNWIDTAKHPKHNVLFKEMVYQPMLELLDYLRANGFKTYIVSGGGTDFMRPWSEEVYGIPKNQVIGSSIKLSYQLLNGEPVLFRLRELDFFDDKHGKPIAIHKFIGRKPIFSAGNSDGDLQMMQWTASNSKESMMLYVHHTDSIREWAYDRHSHVGKFDVALDEAQSKGWDLVDMEKDWKVIYPFDLN